MTTEQQSCPHKGNKMTHVEVLNVMRDFYDGSVLRHPEKVAALTAAIAALEAVGNAQLGFQDIESDRIAVCEHHDAVPMHGFRNVLIIPADAVGEQP